MSLHSLFQLPIPEATYKSLREQVTRLKKKLLDEKKKLRLLTKDQI